MYSFKNNIIIDKRIKSLFDFVKDFEKMSACWADIQLVKKTNIEDIGVGSRFLYYIMNGKEKNAFECEILNYTENKLLCYKMKRCGVEIIYEYNFVEIFEGTEINLIVDVDVYNYPKELATEIFNIIKEEDINHLKKLKIIMEEKK